MFEGFNQVVMSISRTLFYSPSLDRDIHAGEGGGRCKPRQSLLYEFGERSRPSLL
jgi:hypothetical protein